MMFDLFGSVGDILKALAPIAKIFQPSWQVIAVGFVILIFPSMYAIDVTLGSNYVGSVMDFFERYVWQPDFVIYTGIFTGMLLGLMYAINTFYPTTQLYIALPICVAIASVSIFATHRLRQFSKHDKFSSRSSIV
jgi:hypothetical protein